MAWISFVSHRPADAWIAPWRPYVDGDPACQPRGTPLDATTARERQQRPISLPALSLPSAFFSSELRCGIGDLARAPRHAVSKATLPRAPLGSQLHWRHLYCDGQAPVTRHCQVPHGSILAGVLPSSPAMWPGLSSPPFHPILSQ
jgi:hypothetical protein